MPRRPALTWSCSTRAGSTVLERLGYMVAAAAQCTSLPAWQCPHRRQYADAALLQHRVRFSPRYEVEHLATINAMVAAGLGVAALPELAAAVAPQAGLVQRRLVDPDIPRPIGLVTRRG